MRWKEDSTFARTGGGLGKGTLPSRGLLCADFEPLPPPPPPPPGPEAIVTRELLMSFFDPPEDVIPPILLAACTSLSLRGLGAPVKGIRGGGGGRNPGDRDPFS